jgi:hypothetical protein
MIFKRLYRHRRERDHGACPRQGESRNARPQRPVAAMIRGLLPGTDLCDGMALRLVSGGLVAKLDGWWLERGQHIPGYGTATRTALAERMRVTLTKP